MESKKQRESGEKDKGRRSFASGTNLVQFLMNCSKPFSKSFSNKKN
jgi:hypothetical protein